jgi:hypothetical protein
LSHFRTQQVIARQLGCNVANVPAMTIRLKSSKIGVDRGPDLTLNKGIDDGVGRNGHAVSDHRQIEVSDEHPERTRFWISASGLPIVKLLLGE